MSLTLQGLLVIVLSLVIDNAEIANQLAMDIVMVIGIAIAWYGRYRQGDIDIAGFYK